MVNDALIESLKRYLRETLHDRIQIQPFTSSERLPAFIERIYNLFEARIAGRYCVILATQETSTTPSEIAKHVSLVRSAVNAIVVFAAASITAHNRSRLIHQGTSFIVPGNQLYIPELAIDLREHFRALKSRHTEGLSPAAQAVLFHHMLHLDVHATTPSAIAQRLRYSAMSIGRAFDVLVTLKLAKTERHGKERHLAFNADGRQLLELARPLLRNPARTVKYIRSLPVATNLKRAGESALAELTDLSRPKTDTYAVAANDWQSIATAFDLTEVDENESDFAVETWTYEPAGLADGALVDPLSLYAQFFNHRDERVSMAAEKLLERVTW
jgi:DNA-binding MarR family transcriptional regulator